MNLKLSLSNYSNGEDDADTAQIIADEASNHLKEVNRTDMELVVAEDFVEYQILKKK